MLKTLIIDAQKCSGCRSCENYCSLKHEGVCSPAKGRIHVVKWEQEGIFVPINCRRCERPACQLVCPRNATYRNFATGAMEVDPHRCLGCLSCVSACPFGATFVDPETGSVLKCDLCGGDPTCVKVCPTGALTYEEVSLETYRKLIASADQIPLLVRAAIGRPDTCTAG
ncbi:MAG: 4Fe-4S dicluster domain-containing protein [Desulfobacca sp.]|uniref:4Fe-4S dicluster domain-containing protein n=1 Tax=Desulfobacca sp. TaxID=2067990 RepID=UPI004049FBA0